METTIESQLYGIASGKLGPSFTRWDAPELTDEQMITVPLSEFLCLLRCGKFMQDDNRQMLLACGPVNEGVVRMNAEEFQSCVDRLRPYLPAVRV